MDRAEQLGSPPSLSESQLCRCSLVGKGTECRGNSASAWERGPRRKGSTLPRLTGHRGSQEAEDMYRDDGAGLPGKGPEAQYEEETGPAWSSRFL